MRNMTEINRAGSPPPVWLKRNFSPHAVNISLRLCAAAIVMTLLTTGVALCQNLGPYTFTLIDTRTLPVPSIYQVGNLSDKGEVTFSRFDYSGVEYIGTVYLGSGGALTYVANLGTYQDPEYVDPPTVTRDRPIAPLVVFDYFSLIDERIYVGGPGLPALTPIAQGQYFFQHGGINDDGVVAFFKYAAQGSIWKGDGVQTVQIDSDGLVPPQAQPPGINNDHFGSGVLSGTVSYVKISSSNELVLDSNLSKTTLATTCSGKSLGLGLSPINNHGLVAYRDNVNQTLCTQAIVIPEKQIVALSNPNLGPYDINVNGVVAFQAGGNGAGGGIYTGSNLVADKVVATGDVLPDGNTVTGINFGGINDACQLSFSVKFLTPGGATGVAVWRANASKCPAPCPVCT